MSKVRNLTGSVPKELLESGLLGRGIIVSVQQTPVSTGADFDPAHVCVFTVEVALDRVPRYTATCRQAVRATVLPQILEQGVPCQAVIVQTQSLGMRNPEGDDLYAFALTVLAEGRSPYQIKVGNPVPAAAVPLLYPGNTVPAKRMRDGDDRELVIDWEEALTQLSITAA